MQKLVSSKEYFQHVLKPNYDDFMRAESTFQRAINMASSLYHFHEWVFATDKIAAERELSATFASPHDLWNLVEAAVPEAGSIRDLANASKHVSIDRKPSTSMTHIANTSIVSVGWGQAGFGVGRYGGVPSVIMDQGSDPVSLDDGATKVFQFWEALVKKL
jgi:hypothetical protein